MPYLLAALGAFYYIPYMLFKKANHDLTMLHNKIMDKETTALDIFRKFFKKSKRDCYEGKLALHPARSSLVKIVYVTINVIVLLSLNHVLEGNFICFGIKYWEWAQQGNTTMYDSMGSKEFPKPGIFIFKNV